jgi:hypothetical protein
LKIQAKVSSTTQLAVSEHERVVHVLPNTLGLQAAQMAVDCLPRRQIMRQQPRCDARLQKVGLTSTSSRDDAFRGLPTARVSWIMGAITSHCLAVRSVL